MEVQSITTTELGGAITLLVNLGDNRARHCNRQISVNCRVPASAAPAQHLSHTTISRPCPLRSAERPFPPALAPHLTRQSAMTENPFASTTSLDVNPFDDPFADQDSVNKPSQYSHELAASRVAELDRRENDLERRERELHQKAETIRKHGRNNWPPFLPLVYHDISEEIPEASRPLITRLYLLWLVLVGTLIVNMVACIFVLTSGGSDGLKDLIASIVLAPVITILSFLLWYRPIYNGYMKEQSLYFYIYFFFGGWHLAFSLYMLLGIPSTGSAGLIQTIQRFSHGALLAGIFGIIATVGWAVQGLGNAFYYRQIWTHHNAAGHTMEKAKSELATQGAKAYFTRG